MPRGGSPRRQGPMIALLAGILPIVASMQPLNNSMPVYGSRALTMSPPPGGFSYRVESQPDLRFLFPSSELTTCADGGGAFCAVSRPKSTTQKTVRRPMEGKIRQIWQPTSTSFNTARENEMKYRKTCIVEQMSVFFTTDKGQLQEMYWDWQQRLFMVRRHSNGQDSTNYDNQTDTEPRIRFLSAAYDTTLFVLDQEGNLLQRCFDLPHHRGVECSIYGQNVPDNAMWFWRRMNVGEVADVKFRGPIIPSSLDDHTLYMLSSSGQAMEIHFSENYTKWTTFHPPIDVHLMLLIDGQSYANLLFAISDVGSLYSYNMAKKEWKSCGQPDLALAQFEGVAVNTGAKRAIYLLDTGGNFVEYDVQTSTWRTLGHPQGCHLKTPPSASQLGHTMHFFLICDDGALYSYDLFIKPGPNVNKARWTKHGLYKGKKLMQERVVALASDIVYMTTEDGEFVERSVEGVWNHVAAAALPHRNGMDAKKAPRRKKQKRRLVWKWKSLRPLSMTQ